MENKETPPPSLGSTVWVFDYDRRTYGADRGRPIHRGYFRPRTIVHETRVSWVLDDHPDPKHATKVSKKTLAGIYATQQAVDDACWIDANREAIVEAVRLCRDAVSLRSVAAILGVAAVPEPPLPDRSRR